jgi:hypothetical protein
VHYYDPDNDMFVERKEWQIDDGSFLKMGSWTAERKFYYAGNERGRVYRYSEACPSFEYIVRFVFPDGGGAFINRSFHLDRSERYIYTANDLWGGIPGKFLFEFDIQKGESRMIAEMGGLDSHTGSPDVRVTCGHDAWEGQGRCCIRVVMKCSFHLLVRVRVESFMTRRDIIN